MAQNNVGSVKQLKEAVNAMNDALDLSPTHKQFRLQLGVILQPVVGLSVEQTKTAVRKFSQALSSLDEEQAAALTFELSVEDPDLTAIFKKAQAAITPAQPEGDGVAKAS